MWALNVKVRQERQQLRETYHDKSTQNLDRQIRQRLSIDSLADTKLKAFLENNADQRIKREEEERQQLRETYHDKETLNIDRQTKQRLSIDSLANTN